MSEEKKWSVGKMFNEEVLMEDGVIKMSLTTEELAQMLNEREDLKEQNSKLREALSHKDGSRVDRAKQFLQRHQISDVPVNKIDPNDGVLLASRLMTYFVEEEIESLLNTNAEETKDIS